MPDPCAAVLEGICRTGAMTDLELALAEWRALRQQLSTALAAVEQGKPLPPPVLPTLPADTPGQLLLFELEAAA